eukprot:gnl/TRDRNA2_/TRDRNA2_141127_c0_seq1.p1 gnl/TRDRNA2_/TRDRNA2_141127_c0~~gnl/TRDRNA2_/TRDRNA2_141127_c0_seq1.p1  ORF type:complete len:431 (+),score=81.01 gnl/TRDRNA2_/TRDRNA2_141127_c0_seq1:110-1402(+)
MSPAKQPKASKTSPSEVKKGGTKTVGGSGGAKGSAGGGLRNQQAHAVREALRLHDHAALEELAFLPQGFCSPELRRSVWTLLLGLTPDEAVDASWRKLLSEPRDNEQEARTIVADVKRSVYTWDVHVGIRKSARERKRAELTDVMNAILRRHGQKFSYFQGFHDIALVFLEVGSPSQAFHMVERLCLFHMSDQLCVPFDQGLLPLLGVLFFLLELLDVQVANALSEAGCTDLHFAVPWVLTWFAHSLPRLHDQVMRIFDCLLASHSAMILYFCAALIVTHRDTILSTPREMPEMVCAVQHMHLDALDVDEWAMITRQLAKKVPPEDLLARLPAARRKLLPSTSPVLHYPHPWISSDKVLDKESLTALAPIYNPNARPTIGRGSQPTVRPLLSGLSWSRVRSLRRAAAGGTLGALLLAMALTTRTRGGGGR